ncbi:MAG TPA: DUF1611 domain-containing protein [Candidatus Cybelea sp.]|nr:DUF1611 domain-containing protein [Candidatus Cybelea sp.]
MTRRRYAVLAPGHFATYAKTAHGVIAYGNDEIVAVIDPSAAGKRVNEVLPHLSSTAPIVADLRQALEYGPTSLLIGTAPRGGGLPPDWRDEIAAALRANLEIVSGLHQQLGSDPEFRSAAVAAGAAIWDVREPPEVPIFSGEAYGVEAPVVLTVGNDCAVGKMTAALEIVRAARACGTNAQFVPTGQTGIMIAGWGISVDRVIADFAPGAAEQLVLQAARDGAELIVVEGQGAINHPAYAPVTLALLTGCAPDALILVCDPVRRLIEEYATPVLSYARLIAVHEALSATIKPAPVIGIVLNTRHLSEQHARAQAVRAREETGLPAEDVVRFGSLAFYEQIRQRIVKRQPLTAAR